MTSVSSACTWARTSRTAAALPARIWVHSCGSLAATRVTSRIPCPDNATAGSVRSRSRPATSEDASWGTWETTATAASCSAGLIVETVPPAATARLFDRRDRGVGRLVVRDDHPGAAVEEVPAGGDRTGTLATRHRVRPGIPGQVSPASPHVLEHRDLDRRHVGDDGVRPRARARRRRRLPRHLAEPPRRRRPAPDRPGAATEPAPEVARERHRGRRRVGEHDGIPGTGQGDAQAGADEAGADDADAGGHDGKATDARAARALTFQPRSTAGRPLPC